MDVDGKNYVDKQKNATSTKKKFADEKKRYVDEICPPSAKKWKDGGNNLCRINFLHLPGGLSHNLIQHGPIQD